MEGQWWSVQSARRRYERCLLCPKCRARTCLLFTSPKTKKQCYRCPAPPNDHKFYVSADELEPYGEFIIDVPYCGGCEAGLCRVRMEKYGENAGKIKFMCTVKEGKGSCGYSVWKDELDMSAMGRVDENTNSLEQDLLDWIEADRLALMDLFDGGQVNTDVVDGNKQSGCNDDAGPSTLWDCIDAAPAHAHLVEEDALREDFFEENMQSSDGPKDESTLIDPPQLIRCGEVTSRKMKELHCDEEKPEGVSRKRLRDGDFTEHWWMEMAIDQNLGPQLEGWWGRLVFHPLPGLTTPASEPSISDKSLVNSGAKPILMTEIQEAGSPCDKANSAKQSRLKKMCASLDIQQFDVKLPKTRFGSVLPASVSKAFGLAAEHLQNDLITFLETKDATDHESMIQEAEATFDALDHLDFNYEPFKKSVNLFIRKAKFLAEMEQSMPNDDSNEDLEDLCYIEKMKLDELDFTYDLLVDRVNKKRKHLELLQEEIIYTKDLLSRVEGDVSCGLKELKDMEDQKAKMLIEKEVLGVKYLYNSKKLEDSRKTQGFMEVDLQAAKAGFDKARASLRG